MKYTILIVLPVLVWAWMLESGGSEVLTPKPALAVEEIEELRMEQLEQLRREDLMPPPCVQDQALLPFGRDRGWNVWEGREYRGLVPDEATIVSTMESQQVSRETAQELIEFQAVIVFIMSYGARQPGVIALRSELTVVGAYLDEEILAAVDEFDQAVYACDHVPTLFELEEGRKLAELLQNRIEGMIQ